MKAESLLKRFTRYVVLNVMGMIGISLYILADTYFISKALGADGLTALNFTLAVFSVMHGIGLMTGIGGAARYSIYMGLNKKKETEAVLMNSLYIGAAAAVIMIICGIFFSTEISKALGADSNTLAYTEVYMCTLLCFSPCFLLNNILSAFVRNDGNPAISMTAMLTSSMCNIVLDYVFIFIFGMGMYGAVFATGLSPIISLGILTIHLRKSECRLRLSRCRASFMRMISVIKLGVSSFITELSSAVTVVIFNFILLKISGNTGVAAYGIVANTALVATAVFGGISQGMQPLASTEHGRGNHHALTKLRSYTTLTALAVSLVIFVSVFFSAEQITDIFNSENNAVLGQLSVKGLRIYFAGFLFAGVNIVSAAYFSAIDMAKQAFAVSSLRSVVIIVPAVIILSIIYKTDGVWLSFAVAELITLAVTLISLKKIGKWQAKDGIA